MTDDQAKRDHDWKTYNARTFELQRMAEREDLFRKAAADLGMFAIRWLIYVGSGATALLVGFEDRYSRLADAALPYTALTVLLALASAGAGYVSLQFWADSIGSRGVSWMTKQEREEAEGRADSCARWSQRFSWGATGLFILALVSLGYATYAAASTL